MTLLYPIQSDQTKPLRNLFGIYPLSACPGRPRRVQIDRLGISWFLKYLLLFLFYACWPLKSVEKIKLFVQLDGRIFGVFHWSLLRMGQGFLHIDSQVTRSPSAHKTTRARRVPPARDFSMILSFPAGYGAADKSR